MSEHMDPAELPPEIVGRMHRLWDRAFARAAGDDVDKRTAAEAFVTYAVAQMCKISGERAVSRQLYLLAQFVAQRADEIERAAVHGTTRH